MAQVIFTKSQDDHPSTIANALWQLERLLESLCVHNIPWDGTFGCLTNSTLSQHEAATHAPARVPSCQQHPMGQQLRAPRGTRHQLLHSSIALHFSCKCTIPPSPTALRRVPAPTPYGELTGGSNPLTAPAPASIGPPRAPAARGQDGPKLHPQWSSSFTTGSPRESLQIHH